MPSLKTISTFSMSLMLVAGLPLRTTRSAFLPGAMEPIFACWSETTKTKQSGRVHLAVNRRGAARGFEADRHAKLLIHLA